MRRAQGKYLLCRRHSDIVAGVMLGLYVGGYVEDVWKKLEQERRAEKPDRGHSKRKATGKPVSRIGNQARREASQALGNGLEVEMLPGILPRGLQT
ncbi:MAG TPA: hypothetical protein VGH83_12020 [Candidatus Acidoferrum sp.]